MTDGVFNDAPPAAAPVDQLPDAALQKRFDDSQAYIKQLETEAAEQREAIRAREVSAEAERLLAEARRTATPPPSTEAKPAAVEPARPLSEDELVERVLKAQADRQAVSVQAANAKAVAEHLTELYGSEQAANKIVNDRAQELGVGVDFLLSTAKQSPTAFYDLMKLQTAPRQDAAPRGDVNPAALKTNAPGVKPGTPEYYEQLRLELGNAAFFTPKIQQQRFKDMQALAAAKN